MPMFSILLPSRNRLELLKLAIRSVREQDHEDFEIIVSDNASEEDYFGYISSLADPRIKYLRTKDTLSVTDNWNWALQAASGTYVLMLGDDDALTPGLFKRLSVLIEKEGYPDVIYMMAYHFLYPNVNPERPEGHFLEVANSVLFLDKRPHYRLDSEKAVEYARLAVNFRHEISFNAQHYVWRRDFTETLHDFFRPPYPDYYASFYTFSRAKSIIVLPVASIIIGIAKQSFGFFFINNQQDAGNAVFFNTTEADPVWERDADVSEALAFPGPVHYRNWLLTALRFKNEIDATFEIDTDRYRRIQIVESMADTLCREGSLSSSTQKEWVRFESFASDVRDAFQRAALGIAEEDRLPSANSEKMRIIVHDLGVYFPALLKVHQLENHNDIMDAFHFLAEERKECSAPTEPARKPSRLRRIALFLNGRSRALRSWRQ